MTFVEILAQVVVLLQSGKRLTHRALKVRCGLDGKSIGGTLGAGSGVEGH
jgi:hypothetical protein